MGQSGTVKAIANEESSTKSSHQHTTPPSSEAATSPASSVDRKGRPPPKEPKAHRQMREASEFRYRGSHVTETQDYWTSHPERSSPSSEQSEPSTRADSFITAISTQQPPHLNEFFYALQHHIHFFLNEQLTYLKAQASSIAEAYRNFGLLFHSFPTKVIFHDAIDTEIRGFARANFLPRDGYQLPDTIHIIGTLEHALGTAEGRLKQGWLDEAQILRVRAEMALAEGLVVEAMPKLDSLRQAVEVFSRMREILRLERKDLWDPAAAYAKRIRSYQAWAHALPLVCWEGFREGEVDGLAGARDVALTFSPVGTNHQHSRIHCKKRSAGHLPSPHLKHGNITLNPTAPRYVPSYVPSYVPQALQVLLADFTQQAGHIRETFGNMMSTFCNLTSTHDIESSGLTPVMQHELLGAFYQSDGPKPVNQRSRRMKARVFALFETLNAAQIGVAQQASRGDCDGVGSYIRMGQEAAGKITGIMAALEKHLEKYQAACDAADGEGKEEEEGDDDDDVRFIL